MTTWRRRLGAPGAIALAAALVVMAAAAVVHVPGLRLPRLPGLHQPDYSREKSASLAPLRHDFVAAQLGAATVARISPADASSPRLPGSRPAGPGPIGATGSPKGRRPAPAPAASHSTIADVLAPGNWDLRLEFASDSPVVAPGGDIVYTLTIRNVGRGPFNGRVDLRSHVPLFTSYVSDPVCAVETLLLTASAGTDACPLPSLPLPPSLQELEVEGQPVPLSGLTWSTQASIPPGAVITRSFHVTVSPAADGNDILNHAHISVLGTPSQRSRDVVVHVSSQLPVHP